MLNFAIKLFSSTVQSLLMKLLNETNVDVKETHRTAMLDHFINRFKRVNFFVEFIQSLENVDNFVTKVSILIASSQSTDYDFRHAKKTITYEDEIELDNNDEEFTYFQESSYANKETSKSKYEVNEKKINDDFNLNTIVEILIETRIIRQIQKIFVKLSIKK